MAAIGVEAPELVVRELEENLRALLRDMVCGHIDANVTGIADDLLPPETDPGRRAVSEPPEPTFVVRRAREATTDALLGIDDAPGLFTRTEPPPVSREAARQELREEMHEETHEEMNEEAAEQPTGENVPVPARGEPESSGDSEDWGLDEDAADYSAAV